MIMTIRKGNTHCYNGTQEALMSYDFSAFCGNVIQLAAKETFPPELPAFSGCGACAHVAGTRREPGRGDSSAS